jgi:hypothetical protein
MLIKKRKEAQQKILSKLWESIEINFRAINEVLLCM